MDIAGTIVTFGDLAIKIKESIEKVADNKKNLDDIIKEILDTVDELTRLAEEHGDEGLTGQLKTALETLTKQLNTININCQALTQSKGIPAFVKAWFKRDEIEAEIKKLKENRTNCCTQFQTRTEANTERLVNSEREKKIREWFQALDMREKQHATHTLRHPDTGRWVLEGTKFAKWKEEPGCLWIRGISGTGKSVLSSITIDHLFEYRAAQAATNGHTTSPNLGIAYFYFDFRDEKKQLVETMLRSIIMQLSEQSPTPYFVLDQHLKSCQGGKLPTYSDLLVMLNSVLAQFTGTYVVLDALDECSEHDELVEFISTLRGWSKPVHLLVTSQPRTLFLESAVFDEVSVVLLESETTRSDILQFVESELASKSKLKHIKKAKDAAPKIVNKSNGMFRMAACLLQELARKKIVIDIDKILAKLPDDLFGIYARFLQPIDEDDFLYVTALLRWVAFSARPVTLHELDEALAINFSEPDQWVFEPQNRGNSEAVCGLLEGLVIVRPKTSGSFSWRSKKKPEVVSLAHSSVADYIMSPKFLDEHKNDLREAPSHTFLAQSCVTYLLHFENNPLDADTLPRYPLALEGVVIVLKHGADVNATGGHFGSALQAAASGGHKDIVHFLLEHGADVNTTGGHFGSALQAAAVRGHEDIVRFLLDCGADVNTAGGEYGTALQGAAANGNADVLRLLLHCGADMNTVGGSYGTALQGAAANGNADVLCLLLDCGADMNTVGGRHGTALQGAAAKDNVDILRLLLDRGADVNSPGGEYGTALQAAASKGHTDIVRLLLDRGADMNSAGGEYGTALQAAASKGHTDIARLLLKDGADVNGTSGRYGSALQCAASKGHTDIVRLLLEKGADVNATGYYSALQGAASEGRLEMVRLLLERGADVNAAGGIYGSALQGAAAGGHMDIADLFLERGANVNAAGGHLGSALQGAAWGGHMGVARLLLEKGADVNATGGRYGSALGAASAKGHREIASLLREHGALEAGIGNRAITQTIDWEDW
ncbi:ankyrin repeat-containing domain protein [Mycena vitilis]|nr:ankyrin repeat-containing domain protein [Mycena vitilis]